MVRNTSAQATCQLAHGAPSRCLHKITDIEPFVAIADLDLDQDKRIDKLARLLGFLRGDLS
jgi:hypothetical protein